MKIKKYGVYYCNNKSLNLYQGHDVVVRGYDKKKKKYKVSTVSTIAKYNNLNNPLDERNIEVHRNNVDKILKKQVIPVRRKDLGTERFVGLYRAVKYVSKDEIENKKYCKKGVVPKHLRRHIS